jgi:hypothetical protein
VQKLTTLIQNYHKILQNLLYKFTLQTYKELKIYFVYTKFFEGISVSLGDLGFD